jgi:hypothetical protein
VISARPISAAIAHTVTTRRVDHRAQNSLRCGWASSRRCVNLLTSTTGSVSPVAAVSTLKNRVWAIRWRARGGVLAALAEGGFTGTDAVHAFDTLLMFTFGSVHWEIPRTTDVRVRERLVAVAIGDEAAIHIIERANELSQREPTEYFEAGLDTILDGLRAGRGRRRQRSRTFRYGCR